MTICIQIEEDLLHPIQANEKKKHKLKRLVQCPNSFFMDVKCPGCFNMLVPSQFLALLLVSAAMFPLYGNLSTPCMYYFEHMYICAFLTYLFNLFQHHRLQPCSVGCAVRKLQHCVVPAHWRQGSPYRGLLIQEEGRVSTDFLFWGVTKRRKTKCVLLAQCGLLSLGATVQ